MIAYNNQALIWTGFYEVRIGAACYSATKMIKVCKRSISSGEIKQKIISLGTGQYQVEATIVMASL